MKAYRNAKGNVIAVFKNDYGEYSAYIKHPGKENFRYYSSKLCVRRTRQEAEADLDAHIRRSLDRSWEEFELGKGE